MLLQALLLGMLSSCRSWPGPKSGNQGKLPMVLFVFLPWSIPAAVPRWQITHLRPALLKSVLKSISYVFLFPNDFLFVLWNKQTRSLQPSSSSTSTTRSLSPFVLHAQNLHRNSARSCISLKLSRPTIIWQQLFRKASAHKLVLGITRPMLTASRTFAPYAMFCSLKMVL